ncbi:MAG: hypothetical protein IT438_01415, partial [Phycisphaerales bacterium]|nr:hypothetical protein [Phycisphaerales bacterium]
MSVLPDRIVDRIQWFENRIDGWVSDFAAIGIGSAMATAVKVATQAARTAYDNAQAARLAAKAATMAQTSALRTMTDLGSDAIGYIKAFADSQTTPAARDAVFQTANVPPPAPPGPAVAPAAPN